MPFTNIIKAADTSKAGVNEKVVISLSLHTWPQAWDDVEPNYPSHIILKWYNLLECLDALMERLQTWQCLDGNEPWPQPPPVTLRGSALDLWRHFEERAVFGGSEYKSAVVIPIQKPLHDRIDQLLNGIVQLPPESATKDILKGLPGPREGDCPPEYILPRSAFELISSAFTNQQVPEPLTQALAEQARFEAVAADLRPLLVAAENIFAASNVAVDASLKAINDIHDDYNLMIARKFLELTGDKAKAKNYVELAGSGTRLQQYGDG